MGGGDQHPPLYAVAIQVSVYLFLWVYMFTGFYNIIIEATVADSTLDNGTDSQNQPPIDNGTLSLDKPSGWGGV